MNRPGVYDLGTRSITTNLTGEVITTGTSADGVAQSLIDRLESMLAVDLQVAFVYGSGGSACVVVVETSLDQGDSWIEIARFDFAMTTVTKVANLSGLLSKGITTVAALSSEGVLDSVLGDRLRASVTSTGTAYGTGTSVSVRAVPR